MALTVTSRGTGTHNTGATTLVPGGRTATLAAGSMGVLCIAADNAGSGGASTMGPATWTDAKGNVWTNRLDAVYDPGAASAGVEMMFYTAPITVALLTTDLGTITWTGGVSPVAKAFTWYEVIPGAGNSVAYSTNGSIAGATAANAQVTTAAVQVGDAVIAGYFAEGVSAVTGDSDTTNGTWTAQQTATIGATTSGVRIATQQKVQTTTASTQSYDVTVASQDRIAGYIMLVEVVAVTGTGGITVPAATTVGTGAEVFTATGAVTGQAPTVVGTGAEVLTATGALAVPAPTVVGTGTHTPPPPSGTGAISVPSATMAGTGSLAFTGTGAITIPASTVVGTGSLGLSGTGAIVAPAAAVAGTGAEILTATGALTVGAPTVAGTGTFGATAPPVTGTGSITVPTVTVAGLGAEVFTGIAGITVSAAQVLGSGQFGDEAAGMPGVAASSVNVASAIISIGFGQAQSANSQRDSSQSTNRQRDSSRSTTGE